MSKKLTLLLAFGRVPSLEEGQAALEGVDLALGTCIIETDITFSEGTLISGTSTTHSEEGAKGITLGREEVKVDSQIIQAPEIRNSNKFLFYTDIIEPCSEPVIFEPCSEPVIMEPCSEPVIMEPCSEPVNKKLFSEPEILEPCSEPDCLEPCSEPVIQYDESSSTKKVKSRGPPSKYEVHTSKKLRKEIDAYHPSTPEPRVRKESENEMSLFGGSPHASSPPADPPEPEQLIEALQELENAATSDALVREKIANLPAEVSDVSLLSKLQDTSQGRALSEKVEEALAMLEAYNKRLAEEMEARKAVARMLHDYIAHQKDLLAQAEETLEEHRLKQGKVKKVREEPSMFDKSTDISKVNQH
ncbi:uncharacterized protein [Macrobrachium rosenbergii]|uniref:uncharacterized protein isoform X1 n=1 Tax=Macrobrachium rosenbergii TaxID=79674 RepID=UPI0034D6D56C